MESTEIWRPVPGYEGHYEVSDQGRVRTVRAHSKGRTPAGHVLKLQRHQNGYLNVGLHKRGERKVIGVHRIVASAFHGPPAQDLEARHIDNNPANNRADNLEWGTRAENVGDTIRAGNHYSHGRTLTHCKRGHEFTPANTRHYDGRRICRACQNAAARARRRLKRGGGA